MELAEGSSEVRIVRRGDKVKIKVRRSRNLYTYVASPDEMEDALKTLKGLNVRVVEL